MHFHFLGIGGTLMGSVAVAFKARGHTVTGSDERVYPPMSTFLAAHDIPIRTPFAADNLPAEADWFLVGNAMTRGNPEVEALLERKLRYTSLPDALRTHFLAGKRNFVVTGTHGKTTTASLLAWIFETAGQVPSFLIGGIPLNLGAGARLNDSPFCVLEGDEYDTAFFDKRSKFLHYLPECVILNNIEFDHADIFDDLDDVLWSFEQLIRIVPRNGLLVANTDDANVRRILAKAHTPVLAVGFEAEGEGRIRNVRYGSDSTDFTIFGEEFTTPLGGAYNVRNCAAAAAAARSAGTASDCIRQALATFESVKRRQEIRGEAGGVTVMDDFGHHPTAIAQTLGGLRERARWRHLIAVFEPRSNTTRRAVFQHELVEAFTDADAVVLAQVARLDQLPAADRLDPARVIADLVAAGKPAFYEPDTEAIVRRVVALAQPGDLVIVFSNGGFENIHERLLTALRAPAAARQGVTA